MKKILFLGTTSCLIALLISVCTPSFAQTIELGTSYGEIAVDTSRAISVADFFTDFDQQDSTGIYTIKGTIVKTCKRGGCWIAIHKELEDNNDYFIVRFKNHFTIPTNTPSGTPAFFHGTARWELTTVEQLREIAKRNGDTQQEIEAIVDPEYSFGFEADGIVLAK